MTVNNDATAGAKPAKENKTFPSIDDLRRLKRRSCRVWFKGGLVETSKISVTLKVVTPILGGSYKLRDIDKIDIIRAPSVRAHLRFWWRALYGHNYKTAADLYKAEKALWGGAAGSEKEEAQNKRGEREESKGGRSAVEVRVSKPTVEGNIDGSRLNLGAPGAYALWPAREPHADRRIAGTEFKLTLFAPLGDSTDEVRAALTAWILFGGYGGRTRRGLGSLTVVDDTGSWLPLHASAAELHAVFAGENIFKTLGASTETPHLSGASLFVGSSLNEENQPHTAATAWTAALNWLRDFRQGAPKKKSDPKEDYARRFGTPNRPSTSNWPEADKIRHLSTTAIGWAHDPSDHNAIPAWPRAGFGLPIVGQFQDTSRVQSGTRSDRRKNRDVPVFFKWHELPSTHDNYGEEPAKYELRWRSPSGDHDRLASPLIVKALPLANNQFVPCALWLNRVLPKDAEAYLHDPGETKKYVLATGAPFEDDPRLNGLLAPGDTAHFKPLENKTRLRDAFLTWLKDTGKAGEIAP